ncbi:MAG: LysO family transporter [Lutisporaceae bacterium]
MRILLYVLIILAGAWLGNKGKLKAIVLKNLSKIQYACLLLLLFIMGVNIGINKEIISTFGKLGIQALVLALFSIVFSIAAVKLVSRYFHYKEKAVQKDEL